MTAQAAPRGDEPGCWHHVTNRGIAHRPVFEDRRDVRQFLSCLAKVARRGLIEVHAFSVLGTHFHLLLRSPRGRLSEALMSVEAQYVRWFNWRRGRDGSLFRGRFRSKMIEDDAYWRAVVRYIDSNAVDAGLVGYPYLYEHGSARWYVSGGGPLWLEKSHIEQEIKAWVRRPGITGEDYLEFFGLASPSEKWLVERCMRGTVSLVGAKGREEPLFRDAPENVRQWLRDCAALADYSRPGQPVLDPATLDRRLQELRERNALWCSKTVGKKGRAIANVLRVGFLRHACAMSFREIAQGQGLSVATAQRIVREHERLLSADPEYEAAAVRLLGGDRSGVDPPSGEIEAGSN